MISRALVAAKDEIKRLNVALTFYAREWRAKELTDPKNRYIQGSVSVEQPTEALLNDMGAIARSALSPNPGGEG